MIAFSSPVWVSSLASRWTLYATRRFCAEQVVPALELERARSGSHPDSIDEVLAELQPPLGAQIGEDFYARTPEGGYRLRVRWTYPAAYEWHSSGGTWSENRVLWPGE